MPNTQSENLSRRAFLSGRVETPEQVPVMRPPWSTEQSVAEACVGCGDCIAACPEAILVTCEDGKPRVAFGGNECTFCGKCAESCETDVFSARDTRPWQIKAVVKSNCMNASGIACQLCTDTCPESALRLDLSVRPVGAIAVDSAACSGCGACMPVCPAGAIEMFDPRLAEARNA